MKRIFLITIIAVLTGVLLVSTYFISDYLLESRKQNSMYNELSESVVVEPNDTEKVNDTDNEETSSSALTEDDLQETLVDFSELKSLNSDTVGWIKIEDTNINYPVVQTDNNDFYLTHNFYKQYSVYGCPFVQENCSVDSSSDNIIIYAHNMNDGSMFADLLNYTAYDFYDEHKYIEFNTDLDNNRYEIVSVFKTIAETGFRFYGFVNAESEDDFNKFIATCKELSFYDTGVTAEYGDKLISLSTCEYSNKNGRIVVVAKRIS